MLVRFLSLVASEWPKMLIAGIAGGLTILANTALIATSAYLISLAALHPTLAALSLPIAGVRFFGIARAVLRYAERVYGHAASLRLMTRLQVWFYDSIEPHVPAVFAGYRSTDLWQRLVNDVEALKFLYVRIMHPPFVALIVLLAAALFVGQYSLVLVIGLTAGFTLAGIVIPFVARRYCEKLTRKLAEDQGSLSIALADTVCGMEELAAYGMTERRITQVAAAGKDIDALRAKLAVSQAFFDAISTVVANLTVFIALMESSLLVQQGRMEGVLLAVIPLTVQCSFEAVWPMTSLGMNYSDMKAAADRLLALIDRPPAVTDSGEPVEYSTKLCGIDVEELSFTYPGNTAAALVNISFALPPGGKLGIVGPSGAGKSTLASLLLRFEEYQEGNIYINRQDIKKYRQQDVRNVFGVVNQDTYLFHATIRDNLLIARPTASDGELWEVLRQACLADTIAAMPLQLETVVGRDGYLLSGGERQRLAIARALLKDTQVLLFDEPSSGLDTGAEKQIITALLNLPKEKSLLLITHRLIGLEQMDEILVLDKGRVAERGTYRQLCSQQGLFCKLLGRSAEEPSSSSSSTMSPRSI